MHPTVLRDPRYIADLRPPIISIDYEYSVRTGEPHIIGLSDAHQTVCVPHADGDPYFRDLLARFPDVKLLGHNLVGAENEVWKRIGIEVRPEQMIDTILYHYLLNMHLCKAQKATLDEDEAKGRGRGFMSLGAMCSLYTDADNWKSCIGEEQCLVEHRPCPEHTPFEYCGNDTYWPLQAWPHMERQARLRGVDKLYPLHRDLSLVLQRVKARGVRVDVPYVDTLRRDFEDARAEIRAGFSFNPDSPPQVMKHFGLPNAQEQTVRDVAEDAEEGSEIARLLEYKELGKGPDRWFAPRRWNYETGDWEGYVDDDGYIHCNLGIFTSTGRFNCTNPNLQNVAKRRKDRRTGESLGKRVRRAIIAPEGHWLVRADYCLDPKTRILTEQMEWKPISDLSIGEKLVGFDEASGYHRNFRPSTVEDIFPVKRECFRVETDKGSVIASSEHQWVVRQKRENDSWKNFDWVETKDIKPGDLLGWFCRPWEYDDSREGGYIAGFLDGEGFVSGGEKRRCASKLGFGQNEGPLLDSVLSILKSKGWNFGKSHCRGKMRTVYFSGEARAGLRALGTFRPSRLLPKAAPALYGTRIWNAHSKPAKVISITPIGRQTVIAMRTSTRTFIAEGFLSHNCNAENVAFLTLAGYTDLPETDFHSYMRDMIGIKEDDPFALALGGARDAAKSVTHATDYFEGLKLIDRNELLRPNIQREIAAGARLVFEDWIAFDKIVTFTGINLARRAFGDATLVNRKRALDVQIKYFNAFPKLRDLQKKIMAQVERDRAIRPPTGYCVLSYGNELDRLKTAAACYGSNPVAQFMKYAMINAENHPNITPVLSVHDELLVVIDKRYDIKDAKRWMEEVMCFALPEIPNMRLRVDASFGENWADQKEIICG